MGTWRHTVRKVGIRSALFLSYLFVGAGIFLGIESLNDGDRLIKQKERRSILLQKLNISKTTMDEVEKYYQDFEEYLHFYGEVKKGSWNFVTAFFFCGNVMTTIGYGQIVPRTDTGKVVCMFYAFFGIAITGFFLRTVGNELTNVIAYLIKLYERRMFNRETEKLEVKCAIVTCGLLLVMLFLGGMIFSLSEDWVYLDSFYFCFISLTTVGFGDLVPGVNRNKYGAEVNIFIELACLVYYVLGLSIMSGVILSISSVIEEKTKKFDIGDPMDAIKNLRIENLNSKAMKKLGYKVEDDGMPPKNGDFTQRRGTIVPDTDIYFRKKMSNGVMNGATNGQLQRNSIPNGVAKPSYTSSPKSELHNSEHKLNKKSSLQFGNGTVAVIDMDNISEERASSISTTGLLIKADITPVPSARSSPSKSSVKSKNVSDNGTTDRTPSSLSVDAISTKLNLYDTFKQKVKNKVHPSPQTPKPPDNNNNSINNNKTVEKTDKTDEETDHNNFDDDSNNDHHSFSRHISETCLCTVNDKCNHRPQIGLPSELFATNIGFTRKQSSPLKPTEKNSNQFYPLSRSNSSPCHRKVVQRTSDRKSNSLRMQRSVDTSCDEDVT